MTYTLLSVSLGMLLLTSCTKLSDFQNDYLNYTICETGTDAFQSLDYIIPNVRVEVVHPLERAAVGGYFLAGEVHYYDQYNQLLAMVTYGVGPEERWAIKEVFEVTNSSLLEGEDPVIISKTVSGSSICRFEQVTTVSAL